MTDVNRRSDEIDAAWNAHAPLRPKVYSPGLAHAQLLRRFAAQDGKCFYCQRPTVVLHGIAKRLWPDNIATREHLIRRIDGGSDDEENIVMACGRCNWSRGVKTPAQMTAC